MEIKVTEVKFPLGQVVVTCGVQALNKMEEILPLFERHVSGDWGDLEEEDRQENDRSLQEGGRIMSSYHLADTTKIWIITEYTGRPWRTYDRSVTTALLPEEY